ncbi:hypothetical protein PV04_05313 [Phialophora macrospora]|uniref:cAMP-independent regulatory protein pac2 n=1 Tax=Phialophora macrospora TaxID=1851006 RepID=A0A0D2CWA4_9EURO|nr:hypothetical protein PV04_05313 [Phialophora macrospora]
METYNGLVRTPTDAIILFEACRMGILPRVQRRLSEKERQSIRSGSVFVWDEREAGMRRWTDGKSWSASRVSGSFLTYREMEGKRGGNSYTNTANRGAKTPEGGNEATSQDGDGEEGPDGYRYKPDGLMKQSFSITTSTGQHLHLISYYSRSHPTTQVLRQPSTDPSLASITPAKGMYPESTINDQSSVPAVTRSPMIGAPGYVMSPGAPGYHRPGPASPPAYLPPGYIPHHAAYIYPISPMHTPPPGYHLQPYPIHHGLPPLAYGASPYHSPHALHMSHAPPSSYDQRPLRNSEPRGSVPPPPPSNSGQVAPASYSITQPPMAYQSSPAPPPMAPAPAPEQPVENVGPGLQIDPRLTSTANGNDTQANGVPSKAEEPPSTTQPPESTAVSASQAPTINALVHNITTNIPPADKANDSEGDRQGSTSPGGTKNGAPPQDTPSEKLGFREDKRALSKLDRVFAKV